MDYKHSFSQGYLRGGYESLLGVLIRNIIYPCFIHYVDAKDTAHIEVVAKYTMSEQRGSFNRSYT